MTIQIEEKITFLYYDITWSSFSVYFPSFKTICLKLIIVKIIQHLIVLFKIWHQSDCRRWRRGSSPHLEAAKSSDLHSLKWIGHHWLVHNCSQRLKWILNSSNLHSLKWVGHHWLVYNRSQRLKWIWNSPDLHSFKWFGHHWLLIIFEIKNPITNLFYWICNYFIMF